MSDFHFEALVSQALDNALDNHRIEREEFFTSLWEELDRNGQSFWHRVESAADSLVSDAKGLTSSSQTPFEPLRQLHADSPESAATLAAMAVVQHAQYLLGCDVVVMMRTAEGRLVSMLALAARLNPTLAAAAFLKRVGKCYLFGFDAECVVMCRAAIDRTLQSRVSDGRCREAFGIPELRPGERPRHFGMKGRIEAGRRLSIITDEIAGKAVKVSKAGDDAVHDWPECRIDLLDAIADTIQVLIALGQK